MKTALNILSIGEVLWDIVENESHLGGAPFNVCAHLAKMGHSTFMYSSVGDDPLGHEILSLMDQLNVHNEFTFIHESKPTSTVDVFLEDGQPEYTIHEDVAWDDLKVGATQLDALREKKNWDVVIFGLLSQRNESNAQKIYSIINAANTRHVFLDINIRKEYFSKSKLEKSCTLASIVKLNGEELALMRDLFYPNENELRFAAEKIASKFNLRVLIVTLGAEGAWAYAHKRWYKTSAVEVKVADTIGAGDSFSAAFLHVYLQSQDVEDALKKAVAMGTFVTSHSGAIPEYDDPLKEVLGIG
jgi:fructokinase